MSKPTEMSPSQASSVLRSMLYEHECNSAFIDFDSDDEEEVERATEWTERQNALALAIEVLKTMKKEEE